MLPTTRKYIVYIIGGLATGLVCNGAPGISGNLLLYSELRTQFQSYRSIYRIIKRNVFDTSQQRTAVFAIACKMLLNVVFLTSSRFTQKRHITPGLYRSQIS